MSKQSVKAARDADLDALVVRVSDAVSAFRAAAANVDNATAGVFGVNHTDLRLIGILRTAGAMSAGELATAAQLSPPATTTAIQRLVQGGHISRHVDESDRRRATVSLTPATQAMADRLYRTLLTNGRALLKLYSNQELTLIEDFLHRASELQDAQARELKRSVRD